MTIGLVQPTKVALKTCSIGGVDWITNAAQTNFHVKEFRIYEDICKFYFTGELVIETYLNVYETFLYPTAPVVIAFECPRSDGVSTRTYTETFRVYSYDSSPLSGGADGHLKHTISLIGQEYYNDKHNVVTENFKLVSATTAAKRIHNNYVQSNGSMNVKSPAKGSIANDTSAHQVLNKKPSKAIHDLLDRAVFPNYKSSAPTYFRNKSGYVIAPLQQLLETSSIASNFIHAPASGASIGDTMLGYHSVIYMRPLAPAGEASSGVRASDISGLLKGSSYVDLESGNILNRNGKFAKSLGKNFIKGTNANQVLQGATKGSGGGMDILSVINNLHQFKEVDKNGPGQYNTSQEALITALHYAQKYWVSVPGQSGLNVSCGDRIRVVFPINDKLTIKTLFVPRLIHECRFTEDTSDGKRRPTNVRCKTEIYGVFWSL
jgi:hypothetical protein